MAYHGVSRHLENAFSSFEWPDVQDSMEELEEDPASVIEASLARAEGHFKGFDLDAIDMQQRRSRLKEVGPTLPL